MGFFYDLDSLIALVGLPAARRIASENGDSIDLQNYQGVMKFTLDSAIGTGTTPTLDVKLQDSPDDSVWTDVAGKTFTQVTDAALSNQSMGVDTRAVDRYIRFVSTITGSTPVFDSAILGVGQKQVQ